MKLMIDTHASEKLNLINYINEALPSGTPPIAEDDIVFAVPKEILPKVSSDTVDKLKPNENYVYNTLLTVSANSSKYPWESSTVISYRRLDLQVEWDILHPSENITIDLGDKDITPENIKEALSKLMPVRVDSIACDIRNGSDVNHRNVVFTPIVNSLLYIGELTLEYKVKSGKIDLDTLFGGGDIGLNNDPTKGLPGLEYNEKS